MCFVIFFFFLIAAVTLNILIRKNYLDDGMKWFGIKKTSFSFYVVKHIFDLCVSEKHG